MLQNGVIAVILNLPIYDLPLFIQQPIDFAAGEDGLQHQLVPQKLAIGGGFGFVLSLSFFQLPHRGVILLQDGSEHGLEFLFPFRHALTQ